MEPLFKLFKYNTSGSEQTYNSVSDLNAYLFSDDYNMSYDCLEINGNDDNGRIRILGESSGSFIDVLPFIKILRLIDIKLNSHAINRCPELEKIEFVKSELSSESSSKSRVERNCIFYAPKLTEIYFGVNIDSESNIAYFINSGYYTITKITIESGVEIKFGYKGTKSVQSNNDRIDVQYTTGCIGELSNRGGVVYYKNTSDSIINSDCVDYVNSNWWVINKNSTEDNKFIQDKENTFYAGFDLYNPEPDPEDKDTPKHIFKYPLNVDKTSYYSLTNGQKTSVVPN